MQEERIYDLILSNELTWEGLIRDIIYSEGLDPWDINISILTKKYLDALKILKKLDIKISGKFLLAAAILLRMKADYLFPKEKEESKEEEFFEDVNYEIYPNIPQPRKRKVTVEELISALRKAIVVSERRKFRKKQREVKMKLELKKINLKEKITTLYKKIIELLRKFKISEIPFSKLTPSNDREDIIWTFIPLIHLANKGKIKLRQEEEFGEIYVST